MFEESSAILCRGYNGVGQDPDRVSPKSLQLSCAVDLRRFFSYSIRGSMLLTVTPSDRPRRPDLCGNCSGATGGGPNTCLCGHCSGAAGRRPPADARGVFFILTITSPPPRHWTGLFTLGIKLNSNSGRTPAPSHFHLLSSVLPFSTRSSTVLR